MKTFSLLMVMLLVSPVAAWPAKGHSQPAQQQQPAPKFQSDEERAAYEAYFNEKDRAKKLALAKEFVKQFPNSDYAPWPRAHIFKTLGEDFQAALQAFYGGPDGAKLNRLISAGEAYLEYQPGQAWVTTQVAMATGVGALGNFYDVNQSKAWADKALALLEPAEPPQGFSKQEWEGLRKLGWSKLYQYQGNHYLRQANPDPDKAIEYLTKAAEMKDGESAKDATTYWLRAEAYSSQYSKLSEKYEALTAEQKVGPEGKTLLEESINPLVDKMIYDYARVYVLATKPEQKQLQEAAKERLYQFWEYRFKSQEGLNDLIAHYRADPTAPPPPPPQPKEPEAGTTPPPNPAEQPKTAAKGNGSKAGAKPKPAPRKTKPNPRRRKP